MGIFSYAIGISLLISAPAFSALKTCPQVDALGKTPLAWEQTAWLNFKPTDVSKYQVRRRQAELAKILEGHVIHTTNNGAFAEDKVRAMNDMALDAAGEGIVFAGATDGEGDKFDFAQVGFGGGNWLGFFFKQGKSELATALYLYDGQCRTLPPSPYTSSL